MAFTEEELDYLAEQAWQDKQAEEVYQQLLEEGRLRGGTSHVIWSNNIYDFTEEDVLPMDDLPDRFPDWDQYEGYDGIDVESAIKKSNETLSGYRHVSQGSVGLSGDVSFSVIPAASQPAPPKSAMHLLFLLPKNQREVVEGDLIERYPAIRTQIGELAAFRWVCQHILFSTWPLMVEALHRRGAVILGELIRRFTK